MSEKDESKTIFESLIITSDKVELEKPESTTWLVTMDKSMVSTIYKFYVTYSHTLDP